MSFITNIVMTVMSVTFIARLGRGKYSHLYYKYNNISMVTFIFPIFIIVH